ncbi:unnamed protein product [Acanthoscelides obtectus]|uniref:Hydroxylysine kinase n=1 Tax=Acanthoscelides obtectus TaxID=200917 RepID=A0A9P0LCU2_ACAOB|nr:unnamed protein product [Acanthoscelides obtectus]CAK1658959.1 Hydroxylysine kinase [Acanthoscelides obtectus]
MYEDMKKAELSLDEAKQIVFDYYDLKVSLIKELNGYDDKNYYISARAKNSTEEQGYVLKVINSEDSKNEELFEAQSLLLQHLGRKRLPCPQPLLTNDRKFQVKVQLNGVYHLIRLLEYLDGTVLNKVTCTEKLLYHIGKITAELDEAMTDFHHEAYSNRNKFPWMLELAPDIKKYLHTLKDSSKVSTVREVLKEFEDRVLSVCSDFERGLIHGDINEQNILVKQLDDGEYRLKGIIDFGDVNKSCYLFEVAIVMTYMILEARDLDAGGHVIAGYGSVRKISNDEFGLLKVCVEARLCQSLVIGAYCSLREPDNPYILSTAAKGWEMLDKIRSYPEDKLLDNWRAISDPHKNSN